MVVIGEGDNDGEGVWTSDSDGGGVMAIVILRV